MDQPMNEARNTDQGYSLPGRWWQFLRERFEPVGTTLMILSFFGANAILAVDAEALPFVTWKRCLGGFVIIWLVFLHMRLFDEVKDYDFDREFNPERPLARGLIGLLEFGAGTLICLLLELAIAAHLGWGTLTAYFIILSFTLMMRMEFFVGSWLKPKLEWYAISHTFSASIMGIVIFSALTGRLPIDAAPNFFVFALGNWFVFNVFEFGRKTFGREDEKGSDDSYSCRLGPWGAVILLLVNLAVGLGILAFVLRSYPPAGQTYVLLPAGIICLGVLLAGINYACRYTQASAKLYRGTVTFYLLAYHLAILIGGYRAFFPSGS
jgi:4-hydroxybenzoate polyprenyltransferase